MTLNIKEEMALTFDDILLMPKKSLICSRQDVNLRSRLYRDVYLDIPIISANMDTVTEKSMLKAMHDLGGLGICHRFLSIESHFNEIYDYKWHAIFAKNKSIPTIISVGTKDEDLNRIERFKQSFSTLESKLSNFGICIDVAHGHHQSVFNMIEKIRKEFGDIPIIAGNVCTYDGAFDLACCGVDSIKVGVGNGAACATRMVAGVGAPQLTALIEARKAVKNFGTIFPNRLKPTIISDGGIKTSGDIVKALTIADTVMLGSLLAGTYEAPGEIIELDSKPYKCYRGMASTAAMNSIGARKKAAEGIDGLIPYKGSVKDVITKLTDGIRSGMSYLNCANISELHDGSIEAVKITQNGKNESIPHMTLNKNNVFNEKVNYNEQV